MFQVAHADTPGPSSTSVPVTHSCPYCAQMFDLMALLNRHLSKRRKALPLFEQFYNLRDALHGRPQCTHCLGKFAQWTGLIHRIEFNSCTMFDPHRAHQLPPCDDEDMRQYVGAYAWVALFERPDLTAWIRQHCMICARAFHTGITLCGRPPSRRPEIVLQINDTRACLACGIDKAATHSCDAFGN